MVGAGRPASPAYHRPMEDAVERAVLSARELARRSGTDRHDVLVVLGTGLSGAAELLAGGTDPLPLDTLPFWPPYGAGGHRAHAWSFPYNGRQVLVLGGRCHLYEGLTAAAVAHPVRTGIAAGCSTVVLTSAVGAIRDDLPTGAVMVVADHLNLTGASPLHGPHHVDMVDAYAPRLRSLALDAPGPPPGVVDPRPGVYAQLPGPQLETPAEIAMLRSLGADVVGMSMAIETVAARSDGAEVLGLALVTNPAAGEGAPVDLGDIAAVGLAAAPGVAGIVRRVVESTT